MKVLARTWIKKNIQGAVGKRLLEAVERQIRCVRKINYSDYTLHHLEEDIRSGAIIDTPGIGKVTEQKLIDTLRADGYMQPIPSLMSVVGRGIKSLFKRNQ